MRHVANDGYASAHHARSFAVRLAEVTIVTQLFNHLLPLVAATFAKRTASVTIGLHLLDPHLAVERLLLLWSLTLSPFGLGEGLPLDSVRTLLVALLTRLLALFARLCPLFALLIAVVVVGRRKRRAHRGTCQ